MAGCQLGGIERGETTGAVPLETWTAETAHQWKIGRKGHDDGVVLFLFMQDHRVRIEVGYGLESKLPDADAARIINDDIVPRMRADDVDGAVTSGVADMLKTITPSFQITAAPSPTSEPESSGDPDALKWILGAFFGIGFLIMLMFFAARIFGGKGGGGTTITSGGSFFGGSDSSSSSGDDDFDAGGGDFGGGGASGSW